MNESAVYNESDLLPFQRRLSDLRDIVRSDIQSGKHPEAMTKLLERQLSECGKCLDPVFLTLPTSDIPVPIRIYRGNTAVAARLAF